MSPTARRSPRRWRTTPAVNRASCWIRKDPNLARQNPADYMQGFYRSVRQAVRSGQKQKRASGPSRSSASAIDTTGSTPIPVDREGVPLARQAAVRQESGRSGLAVEGPHLGTPRRPRSPRRPRGAKTSYLAKCGGIYSSEWYWSKILHCDGRHRRCSRPPTPGSNWPTSSRRFITGNTDPDDVASRHLRGRSQGDVPRELGRVAQRSVPASLDRDLAKVRRALRDAGRCRRSAGRAADRRGGHGRSGLPAGIPVAVGRLRRAHGSRRRRHQAGHAGQDHRHQHLRHDGLAAGPTAARHSRPVRHRARIGHPRDVRPGSRTVGGGRHLQLVCAVT